MGKLPDGIFIVDPRKERIAVHEPGTGNPIVAIVDTNCDPDEIDLIIRHDDAIRAIRLISSKVAEGLPARQAAVGSPAFLRRYRRPKPRGFPAARRDRVGRG